MNKRNEEELLPIEDKSRTFSLWSYILFWWSSLIVVQAFAVGFFAVYPLGRLNVVQTVVASLIGGGILAIFFIINCYPGYLKGIPYAIQARSSFGIRGAKIATILRSIPALFWYGIGNWIGALAVNSITQKLWGFGNVGLYFAIFVILQTYLAIKGIETIHWFNTIASILITVLLMYTVIKVITTGEPISQSASWSYAGSWGFDFWKVVSAGVAAVITGALNNSDLSRHLIKSKDSVNKNNWLGHIFGVIPPWTFMMMTGIIFGVVAGTADPVEAMMKVAPSTAIGIAMLVFVLGAQISTNLTLNIIPPTHAMQDFNMGITWGRGVIICGIISVFTFPWLLFTSANFFQFMNMYSLFLGPLLGITLADYWIVGKKEVNVESLYNTSKGSPYWYQGGYSVSAIVSLVLGGIASSFFVSISWMIGVPVTFLLYILLRNGLGLEKTSAKGKK